ncbi:hypothetical protein FRB95_012066 [Tulasnella sp. JGI-2019a]|nr:hypothetical protein FRB95_012066 [Tulasnella sp. JGI-2019a]
MEPLMEKPSGGKVTGHERSPDNGPQSTRKRKSDALTIPTPAQHERKMGGPRLSDTDKKAISMLLGKHPVPHRDIADAYHISAGLVSQIATDLNWWAKRDVEPADLPEELKKKWFEGQE